MDKYEHAQQKSKEEGGIAIMGFPSKPDLNCFFKYLSLLFIFDKFYKISSNLSPF